jgi:hypothetical protein
MKQKEILQRIDEILSVLPSDPIAVESAKRYSGLDEVQQALLTAIESLQKLRADLGGNHD